MKNRRICNYLRIKRLFGLLGNWVTRWQPFLFQSSLLFCINDITPDTQRYNFFMNEQKDGAFFIIAGLYLNLVYHQSAIYEFPDSVIPPFPLLVCEDTIFFSFRKIVKCKGWSYKNFPVILTEIDTSKQTTVSFNNIN